MALTPRCYTGTFASAATTSFSLTYSGWTNAGLGVSGTAPATGDIIVIAILVNTSSETLSQTAGTSYTLVDAGSNNSSGLTSGWAHRVLASGDTAPTFSYGTSSKYGYFVIAVAPDAGSTASLDVASAAQINITAGTSFTPTAESAAGTGEVSLILNLAKEAANGANTIAVTAPTGWTAITGSGFGGSSSAKSYLAQICYQTGVGSGSVAPGAETIKAGTSGTVDTNIYHVLLKETTSATFVVPQPYILSQAVKTASLW